MTRRILHHCFTLLAASSILLTATSTQAVAQQKSGGSAFPSYTGEITASNVNVRSGPSTNYYAMVKLQAGDKVIVYGETDGWFKIQPPRDAFSVIHKNFVDLNADQKHGIVNGNSVLVRAGSAMSEHIYARQTKLNRGAEVQVIATHNEDYLRIVPPENAFAYIHGQYVTRARSNGAQNRPEAPSRSTASTRSTASDPKHTSGPATFTGTNSPTGDSISASGQTTPAATSNEDPANTDPHTATPELKKLEADLDLELRKPLLNRDYTGILAGFQALAESSGDDAFLGNYARTRVLQIQKLAESVEAIRSIRGLGEDVAT